MATKKIQVTKNYEMFSRSSENRQTDLKKHKKLIESMTRYGFLQAFPIVVYRDRKGNMVVKDGQHRLAIAANLGLPVYYVEADEDFDVAVINSTAKTWVMKDYAKKFALNGNEDYVEAIAFSEQHRIPLGTAFMLLSGTVGNTIVQTKVYDGTFQIKDRNWANQVVAIYIPLIDMSPAVKNNRFLEACMAVCRVKSFEPVRLLQNVKRCREKLVAYSTREAYLDMLEAIYNFGRPKQVGLKAEATMAMRERNPAERAKQDAPERD